MKKSPKKPWPTKAAMEQIYEKNLWGGPEGEFYSGSGSHHPDLVDPYIDRLSSFLSSFDEPLVVCDLGCGDFNIGRQLLPHAKQYKAVDIVPDLIRRNKQRFGAAHLEFHCMDLAAEELPPGDCAIVRNVLQHLCNNEIGRIVPKLADYDYILLTEHIPKGVFTPNLDIISGQGIRLKKGSGVDLTASPFNMKFEHQELWLSIPSKDRGGVEVTILYHMS